MFNIFLNLWDILHKLNFEYWLSITFNFFSFFRKCNRNQIIFQELSAKVDEVTYKSAVDKTREIFAACNNDFAWNSSQDDMYIYCTDRIMESITKDKSKIQSIQSYYFDDNDEISIQVAFEQILEDINLEPYPLKGLSQVLDFIGNKSLVNSDSQPCNKKSCLETTREVVIRLKMIEWGIFGLGSASAGLYVAEHFFRLGKFFGDLGESNWPHVPLNKKPTSLEEDFNELLTNATFIMSNGTLENISILDLPAFGAIVPTFRQDLRKQFNWPIEINHALFTRYKGSNMTEVFTEYKNLVEDWGHHMEQLGRNSDVGYWTPKMKNNRHLNFTNVIKDEMKTFLMSISGNRHI